MSPMLDEPVCALDRMRLQSVVPIPADVMDQAMVIAYRLYQEGAYVDADLMCRGLLAADPTCWWSYSLWAATLQKLGRMREAIEVTSLGLRHEPGQPKLVALLAELKTRVARAHLAAQQALAMDSQRGAAPIAAEVR